MSEGLVARNMDLRKLQRYQADGAVPVRPGTKTRESVKYRGSLYDHRTPSEEFLATYAGKFDAGEYHGSFTDTPSPRRLLGLRERYGEDYHRAPSTRTWRCSCR
jgi:hypothetical protein